MNQALLFVTSEDISGMLIFVGCVFAFFVMVHVVNNWMDHIPGRDNWNAVDKVTKYELGDCSVESTFRGAILRQVAIKHPGDGFCLITVFEYAGCDKVESWGDVYQMYSDSYDQIDHHVLITSMVNSTAAAKKLIEIRNAITEKEGYTGINDGSQLINSSPTPASKETREVKRPKTVKAGGGVIVLDEERNVFGFELGK